MQKFCTIKQKQEEKFMHKVYKKRLLEYIKDQQKLMCNQGVGAKDILHQKLKSEIQRAQTTQQNYSSTFLDDIQKSEWKYRISNNVFTKLKNSNQKLESIFASLLMIADGCFQSNQEKGYFVQITMPYLNMYQAYMLSSKNNYFILFEVGLHKEFPQSIAETQSHFNYEVVHKITILDILQCNQNKRMMDFLIEYQFKLENNFYRSSFKNLVCTSINQEKQCSFLFNPNDSSWPELMFPNNHNKKYLPLTFQTQIDESKKFVLNRQWQEIEFSELQQRKQQIASISNSNYVLLKYYSDLAMAGRIIDFIEKSPEFKICPSISEKEIIGTKQNSLVIGRSGTGKTTCAILRIFASQYLLKMKVKMAKEKSTNILQDYNSVAIPIRNAFITANQKLVEKVKEYYDKLKTIVKDVAKKNKKDKSQLDISTLSQYDQENYINDYNVFENILDEEQNQQLNEQTHLRRKTLNQLQFPCFISTRDLLILLDKQLLKPYFSKDRLNSLDQRFYIQAGFKLASGINLNEYFPMYNNEKQKIIVPEVDFDIFYDKFWPKVVLYNQQTNDPTALPSLIWTQIFSVIKGSQYSYKYPELSLPYQIYKHQVEKYLSIDQIEQVFHTFIQYEEWKNHQMYFDQLDIVNNILRNFDQLQLELFPLHNIFVDEIQDLPMAVLELMSRIAEQNFMFSGDAAQSILKGVGFRFQDLQSSLENSQNIGINKVNNFTVYKLTTNYRSHNSILQVANTIVTILELLFPLSLDKLQKEISNLKGPKPIIFQPNEFSLMISQLKEQYIGDDCQDIEFGFNQVIIIRNLEEKDKIPRIFENIQVLTVFQAKGLEFDDVILYNFFQSDVIGEQQWDLLLTLDVEDYIMDSQIYQQNITKHQQQDETEEQFEQNQIVKKLKINYTKYQNKKVNINEYTGLCDELKALYVCITRAKKRLFIFDDNAKKRKFIEKILIEQNVCNLVQNYERELRFYKQINTQKEMKKELTEEEIKDWNEKGQFYFDNQIFDEAIKCFKRSKNDEMVEQAEILNYIKKGKQKKKLYKQYEQQKYLPQFQTLANENLKFFQDYYKLAAQRFIKRSELLNAAKCYYSGRFYFDSIEIYLSENLLPEAKKAAIKANCPLLASLISIKQGKILEGFEILTDHSCDVLFQQHILNLALSQELIQQEEVKSVIEQQNYLARSILYLENCQKQEVQVEQQQQQTLSKKQKKQKRKAKQQPQKSFLNFNKQIWEKYYTNKVFDEAHNFKALAEYLEDELQIYQDSQIQLKHSPLIATSIIIKHFDEVYFQLFQTHSIIKSQFNFALIKEEMNQKYSKQEESQCLIDFIVAFLEQGNYINLIQKITQKNKFTYILFQNAELKNQNKNNAQALALPKLDQKSASDILSYKYFASAIATNQLEQYFPYLIENHKKDLIKQEWDEMFDYFQDSTDVIVNQENFICNSISAYFDQFDSIRYQPKQDENDFLSEQKYLILKVKMMIKNLQNKRRFFRECFNIQQIQEIKQFENELENKEIDYLQQTVLKIMNFQFRLENQKYYAPYQYLIDILQIWLYEKDPLNKYDINVLLNQELLFYDKQPLTFLFQILHRFYNNYDFMSKFYEGCEIRQVFLLLKFLYEGANLCCFDTLENSAYLAACSFFKFYVFKSSICSFFSPQWAVVHKSSLILSLKDKIETIQFYDQYILVKTQDVIQIAREQLKKILNSIRFIDILFNIIIRDKNFQKWYNEEEIFQEHIKFLIADFLNQDIEHRAFEKKVLQNFIKICSILNYLRLNIKFILNLDDKSFWNHYIKFQQQNQYSLSFFGFIKWMQFYKSIQFNLFEIYHPELLLHELKQISLTYLLCLLPNATEMKNTNYLTFNFEFLQDQELTALIEQFQIKHSEEPIQEYDNNLHKDNRKILKKVIENFISTTKNPQEKQRRFKPNSQKSFNLLLSEDFQRLLKLYLYDLNNGELQLEAQYDSIMIEATRLIIALFTQIISEAQVYGIEDNYIEQITEIFFIIALNQKRFFTHIQSLHILQDIINSELKYKLEDDMIIDTSKFLIQKLIIFYNTDWSDTKARNQDVCKFEIFYQNQCSFIKLIPYYQQVNFYYSLRKNLYQIKNNHRQPEEILNLYDSIYNLKMLINELSFKSLLSIYQLNDALEIMKTISDTERKLDKLAQAYNQIETKEIQQIVLEYQQVIQLWAQNQANKNDGIYSICQKYLN